MRYASIGMATYEEMRVMTFCRRGPDVLMDNFFSCRLLRRVQQVLQAENLAVTVVLKKRAKRSYLPGWRHVPGSGFFLRWSGWRFALFGR